MITLKVRRKFLKNNSDSITWDLFVFLTGKDQQFLESRINKQVLIVKERGHIKVYDLEFIVGQVYKKSNDYFRCVTSDKTGGLLETIENKMAVKFEKDASQWEIINEDTVNSIGTKRRRRRKRKTSNI